MDSNDLYSASAVASRVLHSVRADTAKKTKTNLTQATNFGGKPQYRGEDIVNTLDVVKSLMRGLEKSEDRSSSPSTLRIRASGDSNISIGENVIVSKKRRIEDMRSEAMGNEDEDIENQPGVNIVRKSIKRSAFGAKGLGPHDHGGLAYMQTGHQVRGGVRGQTMLTWK